MSRQALKKLIQKFEETRDLGVMRGRGRKRISNETVEVAFDVVESPILNILRQALKWYCRNCLSPGVPCEKF